MRVLCFVPCVALGLVACPGENGGGGGTGSATDPSSGTTTGPSSEPGTMSTSPSSLSDATTNNTITATGPVTGDPSDSSTTTGPGGECPPEPVALTPAVALEVVADGFVGPLLVVGDPVDTDVLYVVEKQGRIKRLEPGATEAPAENWLELPVDSGGETGMLGLAFHPDYANTNLVYVAYTPAGGANEVVVTELTVVDGVPGSARDVIGIGHHLTNHNGGMIQFGLDEMLYISVGDGGQVNGYCGYGQSTEAFMGKILRIDPAADGIDDVDPGCPGMCECPTAPGTYDYTIPADNPFVGMAGYRPEIFAYGFRNPWRFSIDPIDGRLWVGDVGDVGWEEVSVIEAGDNAGWNCMEGNHCYGDCDCDATCLPGGHNADGMRLPVVEYANVKPRCAVIGLGIYRAREVPAWDGVYFYGDQCEGTVLAVAFDGDVVTDFGEVASIDDAIMIWGGGYNANGDVFIASAGYDDAPSAIYRIAPAK